MTLSVWDRGSDGTWTKAASWKVHGGAVWRVVWAHPEFGQLLATCSYDRSVHIWEEIRSGPGGRKWQRVVSLRLDLAFPVTDLRFSPIALAHSHQLAVAAGDVHVYNIKVAFDHHGRRLATCSSDMTLSVWDRGSDGTWTKAASWKATVSAQGVVRIYEAADVMDLSRWSLCHELQ
ncbi:WD domain, G-beta repeat protein, partial [Ostertagia ostertagi]